MNFDLIHPYLAYFLYFVILISLVAWLCDFIKKKIIQFI